MALKKFEAGGVAEANEEFRAIEPDLIAARDPYAIGQQSIKASLTMELDVSRKPVRR